jgi:hypothetical protein
VNRAAVGGSVVLLLIVAAVVLIDQSGEGDTPAGNASDRPPQTVVYDADDHGSVFTRGTSMIGATSDGVERWRLRVGPRDQLPFAVCTRRCPAAEVTFARSGATPPDRPDGPRRRFAAPSWRSVQPAQSLRIDRPLLGGPTPLRLTVARPGQPAALTAGPGLSIPVGTTDVVPFLAAGRKHGLIMGPRTAQGSRITIFRQRAKGWSPEKVIRLDGPAQSACISADGSLVGVVGGGMPRLFDLHAGAKRSSVAGARPSERDAGLCAVERGTFVTASIKGIGGTNETLLSIHRRRRPLRVRLTGPLPGGVWVSTRTGATAILDGRDMLLVDRTGRRRTWTAIEAATAGGGATLRLFRRDGSTSLRTF